MTSELLSSLCLGAIANGVKFCTNGRGNCAIARHNKKVQVREGFLYIAGPRQSGFTNHCIEVATIPSTSLTQFLASQHTIDNWIHIFRGLESIDNDTSGEVVDAVVERTLTQLPAGMTPRKRPFRYDPDEDEDRPRVGAFTPLSQLTVEDDPITRVLAQWDTFVSALSGLDNAFTTLRHQVGTDVDGLETRLVRIAATMGSDPGISESPLPTVWDGIALVAA